MIIFDFSLYSYLLCGLLCY